MLHRSRNVAKRFEQVRSSADDTAILACVDEYRRARSRRLANGCRGASRLGPALIAV
jgi:hypothetical protein